MKYYIFDMNKETKNAFIAISSLDGNDVDLFLDYGEDSRPTSDNYTWGSFNFGSDHIFLNNDT